jgi:hypothetical protein
MGRQVLFFAACMLLAGPAGARCDDHLVAPATVGQRLSGAAERRQHDVLVVESALSTPRAASAAAAIGVHVESVRAAVPSLSDGELRDLAARAEALSGDPVAGYHEAWVNDFLIIFLVVAIVILVISAVD